MEINYKASDTRYDSMTYNRCGRSGIQLPAISLGLWHNFGDVDDPANMRAMLRRAFDLGITHFDLANNYGPPYGSAERNFGKLLKEDFLPYRDELIISSKAGWDMWPGPYGNYGSRKYLVASLDQSLKRMGLDYVDIFYHHRPDMETPLEETMGALDHIVRSGKALYAGISQYDTVRTSQAAEILERLGTPCLIHQPRYSLFDRWVENGLLEILEQKGIGSIVFSPLAQGLLSGKYIDGIPEDSRIKRDGRFLREAQVEKYHDRIVSLNGISKERGQSLAQMAVAWVLRQPEVTSALIGASKVSQIEEIVAALDKLEFSEEELKRIDEALKVRE